MRSQEENISGRHLIEFESNAEEVTGQTRGMSTQLSAMVASLIQYAGGETDEAFRTLKQDHDDLQNSISETRNAGNTAAAAEIDAQKKYRKHSVIPVLPGRPHLIKSRHWRKNPLILPVFQQRSPDLSVMRQPVPLKLNPLIN